MNLRTVMVTAGTTIALAGASLALEASPAVASATARSSSAAGRIADSALAFSASVQASALPARYQFEGRVRGAVGGTVSSRITSLERRAGSIWDVAVVWTVTTDGGSFTAHTSGTFDALTDRIAVSGAVDRGVVANMDFDAVGRIAKNPGGPTFDGILEVVPAPGA